MCAALPQSLGARAQRLGSLDHVAVPEARLELEAAALAARSRRAVHRGEEVDEELHRQRAGADGEAEKPLLRREAALVAPERTPGTLHQGELQDEGRPNDRQEDGIG